MDTPFLLILIVWSLIPIVICAMMANGKERSGLAWGLMAFVFGWIAVLVLLCLPKEQHAIHRGGDVR